MTVDKIMYIDYRTQEGKDKIKKALYMMKPFERYKNDNREVPIEAIEKAVSIMCRKYDIMIQWAYFLYIEDSPDIVSITIMKRKSHEYIATIQCNCLYEMIAKACIRIYSEVKSGKVGLMNEKN